MASFHSDKNVVQIYIEDGKSNPEEVVGQLWIYKLITYYDYLKDEIEQEKPINLFQIKDLRSKTTQKYKNLKKSEF